jgi:hypothetical protein
MMIAVLSLLAALAGNSISGVVKDTSGAVVPGASIIARTTEGDRVAVSPVRTAASSSKPRRRAP